MRKLLIASLLINIVLFVFLFIPTKSDNTNIESTKEMTNLSESSMPWLNLDKNYFSIDNLQWGSFTGKIDGDINSYDNFAISNIANFQSYPIISNFEIKNYSSETKDMEFKSYDEMINKYNTNEPQGFGKSVVEANYKKYGQLSLYYLPEDYIVSVNEFDVDNDGINEQIVMHNFVGSADGGSYSTDILKNYKIIFSTTEDNSRIIEADNNNGFYIEWNNSKYGYPRCCEDGFTRTRFVYKDNKFIPVYEQEVRYLKIGDGKN